jgi:hypothetical protein
LQLPAWGIWYAHATLDAEVELEGAAVLELAGLRLSGTLVGGPSKGSSRYRIVGGRGGWGKTIKRGSYTNDAGVKLATVLLDAARAAGEELDAATIPARTIGPGGARPEDPASRVLELHVPQNWYVGEDGITRVGRRPAVTYTGAGTRGELDVARGMLELAADELGQLVPGVVIDGLEAYDVEHELDSARLRSTIWGRGTSSTSRRLAAHRKLLLQLLPDLRYRGVTEYRVVTQEASDRINLQAVRVSLGMPDLRRVHVRAGIAGARADLALGSRVLVTFVDGAPGRPVIVGFEEPGGGGFLPNRLDLGKGLGRVLREGDTLTLQGVQANPSGQAPGVVAQVTIGLGLPPEPSRVFA